MCGIYMTAQSKHTNAGEKVFRGLKRIEYRGYDSWGVAVLSSGGFQLRKKIGKLRKTRKVTFAQAKYALGHTRWATHGGVTQENAHPHAAKDGSFVLAQNGVVENYQELREQLLDYGYEFDSQTDTEVIVGLIEREMKIQSKLQPDAKTIRTVFQKLAGRNTVALLTKSGNMFAIRNGSPLVVGRKSSDTDSKSGDGEKNQEVYFSSDIISMSGDANEYMVIQSGQMVVFSNSKLQIFDIRSGKKFLNRFVKMDLSAANVSMAGFESFMLKEIYEQAKVIEKVLDGKEKDFQFAVSKIKKAEQVLVIGAGTASFAAMHTAYLFRKSGIKATAVPSYEADSYQSLVNKKTVCVVYSQSGETADTNEVVEWMLAKGAYCISAVNMPGSTLTQLSHLSFMLTVGPELAVASTKAFLGHMLVGTTIYSLLCGTKLSEIKEHIVNFEHSLSEWLAQSNIQEKIRSLAVNLARKQHLFVLGRGDLYAASLESALKLKEISYIHAEGFSGGELKHGVIALVEQGTPVLCLVAKDESKASMLNAIAQVNARGGYTIVVASEDNELYKEWIEVPELPMCMPLMSVIPAQLLTCYIAMKKGLDVDKPRNLAKSVTVK